MASDQLVGEDLTNRLATVESCQLNARLDRQERAGALNGMRRTRARCGASLLEPCVLNRETPEELLVTNAERLTSIATRGA